MTSAELKTTRESLGLTADWLAKKAGVQLRTVRYWESGRNAVPKDVAKIMTDLQTWRDSAVAAMVQSYEGATPKPDEIVLLRYRDDAQLWTHHPGFEGLPVTFHASALLAAQKALQAIGCRVKIVYMNSEAYTHWLAVQGFEDSESARTQWAALQ